MSYHLTYLTSNPKGHSCGGQGLLRLGWHPQLQSTTFLCFGGAALRRFGGRFQILHLPGGFAAGWDPSHMDV